MNIFDRIFRRKQDNMEQAVTAFFQQIGGYVPTFTTFEGGIYEMELTRAAIHTIATHISKLNPVCKGSAAASVARILKTKPNPGMDTKKYLYRLGTLLMTDNNVIIAPLYDNMLDRIVGYYPLMLSKCEIVEYQGVEYVRYRFEDGTCGAVPLVDCGILTQFQYNSERWGETNAALRPTLDMLNARNESIIEGVKSSGIPRFIAKMSGVFKDKSIDEERNRFIRDNLAPENTGGVIMVDGKYADIKEIQAKGYIVDEKQTAAIKDNVYTYFGVNEDILQNKFTPDEWTAFYGGKIEPIALELSMVHTNMTFSDTQKSYGNEIVFYANRLQYMTNTEKLQMVTQLFDRGFLTHNQGLQIFDMPPVEGGDVYYIRKEYAQIGDLMHELNGGLATGLGVEDNANETGEGVPTGAVDSGADGGST